MRSRVLFSLCLTGVLLACASGSRSSAPEAAVSDTGLVHPCSSSQASDGGVAEDPVAEDVVVVDITSEDGKVHFSSTIVKIVAGQTLSFESKVKKGQCIAMSESDSKLLTDPTQNPLWVAACGSGSWTLKENDKSKWHKWWSFPASDPSKCNQNQQQGIQDTVNGTLEVSGR